MLEDWETDDRDKALSIYGKMRWSVSSAAIESSFDGSEPYTSHYTIEASTAEDGEFVLSQGEDEHESSWFVWRIKDGFCIKPRSYRIPITEELRSHYPEDHPFSTTTIASHSYQRDAEYPLSECYIRNEQ